MIKIEKEVSHLKISDEKELNHIDISATFLIIARAESKKNNKNLTMFCKFMSE